MRLSKTTKILVIAFLLIIIVVIGIRLFSRQRRPPSEGQFVGSKNSDVYHYPSCTYAQRIKPENRIWFKDAADAKAHGYHPCSVCKPP